MFATGLPQLGVNFFPASGMLILDPCGLQIFCWHATSERLALWNFWLVFFGFADAFFSMQRTALDGLRGSGNGTRRLAPGTQGAIG